MSYSINAVARRVVLSGSAGVGAYSFSFEILASSDIEVYLDSTKLTLTTDYAVTINSNGTGSVTLNTGTTNVPNAPTSSNTITIIGSRAIARTTDFVTAGDLKASSLNEQLDSLTIFDQQISERVDRSIKGHITDSTSLDMGLPSVNDRKGKYLAFNATSGAPEAGANSDDVTTLSAVTTDIAALADIEDGTTATDAISGLAAIKANVTTVAGVASNVTTVAGIASNVTAVAGDATDIGAVAGKATEIGRLGTADAVSDLNTLGTADAVSDMNTLAAISANISTVAGVSSNVTTVAGISSNVTTVAGQTTNLQNVTDNLSAIQNASSNATAAAQSASSAASALDSFDDRYLGSKTSNPTVDNDGNALVAGALYFNSSSNEMRVYDGANWIAATSAGNVSLILYEYTATSNQTTFSGSDDNSATLSYTVSNLQVVMNGVILDPSDFTATSGTSVVLASGAATGDLLNIYAFKSFTVSDTVSASAGGTFAADVAFTANANFGDSDKAQFGAGSDLQIYHDGSNSYISDQGTNDLKVLATDFQLKNAADNEFMMTAVTDGAVTMYHNNSAKIATTSSGVDVTGTVTSDGLTVDSGTTVLSGTVTNQTSSSYATNDGGIDNILSLNSTGSSNTQSCGIQFSLTKSGQTGAISEIGAIRESSGNSGLVFRTRDSGTGRNERMRIDSLGNLLLGITDYSNVGSARGVILRDDNGAQSYIQISNTGTNDTGIAYFYNGNGLVGNIRTSGSATSYLTSSDYRLKENVTYDWDATTRLKQLKPARFNFIADADTTVDGFIAHEVQGVVPEAISGNYNEVEVWKDGEELPDGVSVGDNKLDADGNTIPVMQAIDQSKIVPLLVKTILELEARITALEAE